MALGFDMADPIVDPNGNVNQRVNDWNLFFNAWDNHPVFGGRYFGLGKHNWIEGEIPKNLRSLVPNFDNLRYILPFTPGWPKSPVYPVDDNGNMLKTPEKVDEFRRIYGREPNWRIAYQMGWTTGLDAAGNVAKKPEEMTEPQIKDKAEEAAFATCEDIVKNMDLEWDPNTDRPIYNGDLKLPDSMCVFVFLSVEPWTRLHHVYWNTWADVISTYPVIISVPETDFSFNITPFRPCLYCNVNLTDGPNLKVLRDIFNDTTEYRKASRCYALMTPFFNAGNYELGKVYNMVADEESIRLDFLNSFSFAPLKQEIGNNPDAEVLIWQYYINLYLYEGDPDPLKADRFSIDLSITTEAEYANRSITDYMLEINW